MKINPEYMLFYRQKVSITIPYISIMTTLYLFKTPVFFGKIMYTNCVTYNMQVEIAELPVAVA